MHYYLTHETGHLFGLPHASVYLLDNATDLPTDPLGPGIIQVGWIKVSEPKPLTPPTPPLSRDHMNHGHGCAMEANKGIFLNRIFPLNALPPYLAGFVHGQVRHHGLLSG